MSAKWLAWGRLLRLSLAPSALADGAAGLVLAAGAWPAGRAPLLLLAASALIYHGGMALNDWADRAEDARQGRGRPLQSGGLRASSALAVGLALLGLGPVLAWYAAPRCGLVHAAVAGCAALYDLAGRGAWRGPLLLALCRAGNLGAGLALASTLTPLRPELLATPLLYGAYVFLVSRVALLEDAPPGVPAPRLAPRIDALALALLAHGLLAAWLAARAPQASAHAWFAGALALFLALLGASGLWRARRALHGAPHRSSDAGRVAGMALRRLLVASATLALGAGTLGGLSCALAILSGYPLSFALRRVFPPT